MMIVAVMMSPTFDMRGMEVDGDVEMSDRSQSRNGYHRFDEDLGHVHERPIHDSKTPKKIDNAAIVRAEEQRFNAFKAVHVDDLYEAIRNADVEGVQQILASDAANIPYIRTEVAFDCALEEKKPDVFVQRCEIFRLMQNRTPCYESGKIGKHGPCIFFFTPNDWKTSRPKRLLHTAAKADSVLMVNFLLDSIIHTLSSKIISIDDEDDYGRTALFFARSKEMVALLIRRGIKVHKLAKYRNGRWYRAYNCPYVPEAIRNEIKRQAEIEDDTSCC